MKIFAMALLSSLLWKIAFGTLNARALLNHIFLSVRVYSLPKRKHRQRVPPPVKPLVEKPRTLSAFHKKDHLQPNLTIVKWDQKHKGRNDWHERCRIHFIAYRKRAGKSPWNSLWQRETSHLLIPKSADALYWICQEFNGLVEAVTAS